MAAKEQEKQGMMPAGKRRNVAILSGTVPVPKLDLSGGTNRKSTPTVQQNFDQPRDFTPTVAPGTPMVQTEAGEVIPEQGYDWEQEMLSQEAAKRSQKASPPRMTEAEFAAAQQVNPGDRQLAEFNKMMGYVPDFSLPGGGWTFQARQRMNAEQAARLQRSLQRLKRWADENPEEAERAVREYDAEQFLAGRIQQWKENDSEENLRRVKEALVLPSVKSVWENRRTTTREIEEMREANNKAYDRDFRYAQTHGQIGGGGPGGGITAHYRKANTLLDYAQYANETVSKLELALAEAGSPDAEGKSAMSRVLHGLTPRSGYKVALYSPESEILRDVAQIEEKLSLGKQISDPEKALVGAYFVNLKAQIDLDRLGGSTNWEKAGNFVGENLPFLLEMACLGGLGGSVAGAARGIMRKGIAAGIKSAARSGVKGVGGKLLRNRAGRWAAKQGANIVASQMGGMAMAPFSNATWSDYAQRTVDQYDLDMDENGEITAQKTRPASELERGGKAYAGGAAELGSELWGGYAGVGRLFPKASRNSLIGRATRPLRGLMSSPAMRRFDSYVGDVFKWDALPMEWAEEQYAAVVGPLLAGEPERVRENFTSEAVWDTTLGVMAMGGAFKAVGTLSAGIDHVQSRRRSAGLLGHIENPDLRRLVSRAMGLSTLQEQAKALANIDWDNASLHDMAAATDYIVHRTQGRASQEIQNALQEQTEAKAAVLRFDRFKNQDTGNLEEVFDAQGRRFYLAGGTIEKEKNGTLWVADNGKEQVSEYPYANIAQVGSGKWGDVFQWGKSTEYGENGELVSLRPVLESKGTDSGRGVQENPAEADGTLFVIDAETGEVSQKSIDELKRGKTTSYEEFETETLQGIRTVSAAQSEMETLQDIAEEAEATGDNPTLRVADYKGLDLNTLAGQTVTLTDGSQAYINQVSTNRNGAVEIDAVPIDPATGLTQTGANGEEIHRPLDITEVAAVDGIPVGPETVAAQTTQSEDKGTTSQTPELQDGQPVILDKGTPVGTENPGLGNGSVPVSQTTPDGFVNANANSDAELRDENGHSFVVASDGSTVFGYIAEETGLTPAPIRLSTGEITNNSTKQGYGLVHIEARHGDQIRQAGFKSVEDFVETVARNYEQIKEGKTKKNGTGTYLLQVEDAHNNTLYVELSKDGSYWNINSAGVFKKSYARGNKVVYSRHTTTNQTAESDEASQTATQSGAIAASRMNAPTENKDTNSGPKVQIGRALTEQVADTLMDENGLPFVTASDGSINFGSVENRKGMANAPIRVSEGFNTIDAKGNNHGYGLKHIEASHGQQIRAAGYDSVTDFIEQVARNYTTVKQGKPRGGRDTYLLEWNDEHNNTLFVELSNNGEYWNVNSAGIFREDYSRNKEVVRPVPAVGNNISDDVADVRGTTVDGNPMSGNSLETTSLQYKTITSGPKVQIAPDPRIGRPMTAVEAGDFIRKMQQTAEPAPELELTPENWMAEFGEEGIINTPIGEVKQGDNQYLKLAQQGRNGKLGMVKPTLESPAVILEDTRLTKDGKSERDTSYVFIKPFTKGDGSRYYYFTSVTVSKEGREVVISSQERSENRISKLLQQGNVAWIESAFSLYPTAQVEGSVPLNDSNGPTTTDNQPALLGIDSSERSESKGTNSGPKVQIAPDPRIGRPMTSQEAEELVSQMDAAATMAPIIELSEDTWESEFPNGEVNTPMGIVKFGEHQLAKLFLKKRQNEFGMLKSTLVTPDVIINEPSKAKDGQQGERDSSYLFVKTFIYGGKKVKYYTSITVKQDGMEVVISNHISGKNVIEKKMQENEILHLNEKYSPSSSDGHLAEHSESVPDLLPTQGEYEVYSVPAVGESIGTDTSEVNSGQSIGATAPAGNSSGTSLYKGTNSGPKVQEAEQDIPRQGEETPTKEGAPETVDKGPDLVTPDMRRRAPGTITVREQSDPKVYDNFIQQYDIDGQPSGVYGIYDIEADINTDPVSFGLDEFSWRAENWDELEQMYYEYKASHPNVRSWIDSEGGAQFRDFNDALEFKRFVDTQKDSKTVDPVHEAATPTEKSRAVGEIVAEMNRTSGATAFVFNDVSELPKKLQDLLGKDFEHDGITWHRESYICAPQMKDAEQTRRTYIHEVGGHQNIEHAIATAAEKGALWEAIVEDIGLDGLHAWGISELNEEIANYEAGEMAKWQLGREALAYATELNTDLPYFDRQKPLSLTVDLNRRITPETIRAILETANRYDDQRPSITITGNRKARTGNSLRSARVAERRSGVGDIYNRRHTDLSRQNEIQTAGAVGNVQAGSEVGQTAAGGNKNSAGTNSENVSGQDVAGADRAEPGALPAGETVDHIRFRQTDFTNSNEAEIQSIIDQAKTDGTYLKAPNGKPTRLSERQWAQVRTRAFKNWFGDWEDNAEIKAMQTRIGDWLSKENMEWADGKSRKQIAEKFGNEPKAIAYIPMQYLSVVGENLTDNRIYSGMGYFIDHAINHHPGIAAEKYSLIQDTLNNPDEIKSIVDNKHNSVVFIKWIERYNAVVIELEKSKDGKIIWHKSFYNQRKKPYAKKGIRLFESSEGGVSSIIRTGKPAHGSILPALDDTSKIQTNIVSPNNDSSKVLDENGEPRVVQHWTPNEFTVFDIGRLGENSGDDGVYGRGFYFGNKTEKSIYGDKAISAFLSLQNPLYIPASSGSEEYREAVERMFDNNALRHLVVHDMVSNKEYTIGEYLDAVNAIRQGISEGKFDEQIREEQQYYGSAAVSVVFSHALMERGMYETGITNLIFGIGRKEFTDALKIAGYDGVITDSSNREYVAFAPSQIKSATDNTGEFSADNDDIRFRKTPKPQEESASLIGVHNTTEEQLKKSLSLGGFPMPSIAITQAELGHTEFGEISLLFDKNTIDPSDRRNRVYGGDAWTPMFPKLGVKIGPKALETASAKIKSLLGEELCEKYNVTTELNPYNVEAELERNNGDVLAAFARDDWMKHAYLKSRGEDFTGGWGDLYDKVPTGDKSYREWVANVFDGLVEKIGIRNDKDLFTPIGNRRKWETLHDEVTLDNVVKAMKKQAAKGGESVFGGNIFGSAQEEYKSLAEIRKAAKKRLRKMTENESSQVRNDITDRLSSIDIPTQDKSFGTAIDMAANITEAVKHSHTANGIYAYLKTLYPEMTLEIAEEISDIVKDIRKMGTRYFEAKPYRAVGFDEIRLAVVPSDTDAELVRQLERRRIPVRMYERGNEQQRREMVADATAELGIRFRQKEADRLSPEEINTRFNEELQQLTPENAQSSILWLGMPSDALLAAGIRNAPIKLYGNKLLGKIAKHGYTLNDIRNLPEAVAQPIAVFNGSRPESYAILTELKVENGDNVLVSLSVGKGNDADFNLVSSVYGKNNSSVAGWVNQGKLLWVDKEKALDRLRISAPLAEAQNNQGQNSEKTAQQAAQEFSSVANIIKNFTNPTLREGEKVSAAETMASELGVSVRVVRSADEIGDAERDARRKRGSTGWHDRATGEVAVVLPNCRDVAEVQKTILHEAVGHYGIPQLLGRERADELFRRVFASLDTATRRRLMTEYGSETVAGDEYLAKMAEGNVTPGVFRRMMAAIRNFFRDVLGIDLKMTDAEMRYILWRSKNNLQRARTVGEAMDTIAADIRMRAQTEREAARERKAQQLEKLRDSKPLRFTGDEYEGLYELNSRDAGRYIVDHLRGTYTNADSGETIYVSRKAQKVAHHDAESKVHLQSVAYIPRMLENAIFIDEIPNTKTNTGFDAYRYYVCGLKIGGTDYTAKLVVGVSNRKLYYDHALTQMEKGDLIVQRDLVKAQVYEDKAALVTEASVSEIKDKRLVSVLQPEPLVYQQKSAKNEPKTALEYIDRVRRKAERLEKLRRSEPLVFSGDEYKGKYELTPQSATRYILDNIRGEYVNTDTGEKIQISRKGAEKVTGHDLDHDVHLRSVAYIPQLLENATFIDETPNTKSSTGFDSYKYYVCGLKIGGVDYTAKLVVGQKNGETYYDHALTEIEKGNLLNGIDPLREGFAEKKVPDLSTVKDKRLLQILQPEPLVYQQKSAKNEPKTALEYIDRVRRKAERLEKLRRSEPLVFSGDEYKGKYELTPQSATRYILDNIRGEYVNTDTGEKIQVSRRGTEKTTGHDLDRNVHLRSVAYIPQMLENAVLIDEMPNTKSSTGFDSYRYYVCGLKIGDTDYTAKIVVGVSDRTLFYDHALTEIEKGKLLESIGSLRSERTNEKVPDLSIVKDKRLLQILQPEPLVYQQKSAKNEPKTPMQYVDRVAEEMAARDNEIRFRRRSRQTKQGPNPNDPQLVAKRNTGANITRKVQDATLPVRQLQDWVRKHDGEAGIDADMHSAMNRATGIATAKIQNYDNTLFRKLDETIAKIMRASCKNELGKIDFEQIDEYVAAKSSMERQAAGVKAYSENPLDPWNREYVETVVREFENEFDAQLVEELWERIRAVAKEQRKVALDSGLISAQQFRDMENRGWKYYAPLQGIDAEFEGITPARELFGKIMANNPGFRQGVKNLFRRAMGRETKADNVLATLQANLMATTIMGERNKARLFLLRLVEANPQLQGDTRPAIGAEQQNAAVNQTTEIEKINTRFNEELKQLTPENAQSSILWLGMPSDALLAAGIRNAPIKLYGNKLLKKMNKHGFKLEELKDLPQAVANPIFVFAGNRAGSYAVLTELKTEQGNVLTAIDVNKNGEADVNIVSSVFGKDDNGVLRWIDTGKLRWVDKEKARSYISAPALSAGATYNTKAISSATNIVKNFANPTLREGEKVSAAAEWADDRNKAAWLSPEEINTRFNEELQRQIDGTLPQGHIYRMGMPSEALHAAGVPDLPIELSATRLAEKANPEYASNHPFALEEVADLPRAIAEPIAVFDSKTQTGCKVILTELQHDGNNFVVVLRVRKSDDTRKVDVEVNDIRSLYPKDRVGGIIEWINNGLLRWVDKEKAAEFISTQWPNYIGGGENIGGSATDETNLQRINLTDERRSALASVANIVKNFENPSLPELKQRKRGIFEIKEEWYVRRDPARMTEEEKAAGKYYDRVRQAPTKEEIDRSEAARAEHARLVKELELVVRQCDRAATKNDHNRLEELMDRRRELAEQVQQASERITVTRTLPRGARYAGESAQEDREHEVVVFRHGTRTVIRFSDPLVAKAVNNHGQELFDGAFGTFVDWTGRKTRWLASASTQWNPAFFIPNNIRDMIWAGVYNAVDDDGNCRGFVRNIPHAYAAIARHGGGSARPLSLNERARCDIYSPEGFDMAVQTFGMKRVMDALYDDFRMEGGLTGYSYMQEPKDLARKLKNNAKRAGTRRGKIVSVFRKGFQVIGDLTEVSTRFASFLSQIQAGADVRTAVNYARNITVNFNTRGEWGRGLNQLFMFFNASPQGVANLYKLVRRNPKTGGVMIAMVGTMGYLAMTMMDWALEAMMDDDEGDAEWAVSEYERYTNLLIPGRCFGWNKGFVKIPIPQELRPFWIAGVLTRDMVAGRKSAEVAAKEFASAMAQAFSPLEINPDQPTRAITPSVVEPIVEINVWNTDFAGRRINRVPYPGEIVPDSQLGNRNAWKLAVWLSEALNRAGGGNEFVPAGYKLDKEGNLRVNRLLNLLEISPSTIEHIVTSYMGGLGREIVRGLDMIMTPAAEWELRNIPGINRFVGEMRRGMNENNRYYDIREQLNMRWQLLNKNGRHNLKPPYYITPGDAAEDFAWTQMARKWILDTDRLIRAEIELQKTLSKGSVERRESERRVKTIRENFVLFYDEQRNLWTRQRNGAMLAPVSE